jgi:hypothetical protein
MKIYMGEWRYSSTIINLGTRWRLVVSFTPLPLYPLDRLDTRLDGSQSRSARHGEEKNLAPARNRTPAIQLLYQLELSQLSFPSCNCNIVVPTWSIYLFTIPLGPDQVLSLLPFWRISVTDFLKTCVCKPTNSSPLYILWPWRWRDHVSPNYLYPFKRLHGVTIQKTTISTCTTFLPCLVVDSVRTSVETLQYII